jgi:hypothetical protein
MLLPTAARSFIEDLRCKYGPIELEQIIANLLGSNCWVATSSSGEVFVNTIENPKGGFLTDNELVQLAAKLWAIEESQQVAEAKFNTQWNS